MQNILIEGYSGQLEKVISVLEAALPEFEVMSFSGRAPAGIGKNLTITIDNVDLESALKVEDVLLSNDQIFVGYYGDKCFYNISEDHGDWYYLTGKPEDQDIKKVSLKDLN